MKRFFIGVSPLSEKTFELLGLVLPPKLGLFGESNLSILQFSPLTAVFGKTPGQLVESSFSFILCRPFFFKVSF